MKQFQLRNAILLVAVLFTSSLFAQDWVKMMQDPNANFFETQYAFNQYVDNYKSTYKQANGVEPAKIPGYKQFKRWEWFMAPRVSQTGERFAPDAAWNEMSEYKKGYNTFAAGNWTPLGPSSVSNMYGAGRVNFIRRHPTNASTIYVGSPSGGLWISTNDGGSWASNTDKLNQVIGCTDIAFDPVNSNIMYMATGDGDAGDNYSVGLLKSTDGAATWNTTGLTFAPGNYRMMSKVLVDPSNGNNILVATSGGIYRSTDAGVTFSVVQTGSFKDMEFKPGTPATIYAVGTSFYKSTNSGATWTSTATGLPAAANLNRMAIAVTAADVNAIYLVAMKATTYDMYGVYKSTNSGTSFTTLSTNTPNIGNQGWYDLCIAANPSNASEVMLGGQTQFMKTTNGGSTWSQIATTTHVDYHDVIYTNGTTCYLTSDGGVWKSINNGSTWSNLSNGLSIHQWYGFGHSSTTANLMIAGAQDNGTSIRNSSGIWGATWGGDGMLAFVSWNNNNNMWCSRYDGDLYRSINGGGSWSSTGAISETCPWVTEWNENPVTANTLYAGCANVWRSTNGGVSWTKPGNVAGTSTVTITSIAVSPANTQVIWTAKGGTLYKTINGGTTWTAITTLPSGTITDIVCHNTDVNKAWVCFSGYSNANKVFQTTNQGTSWTNLSASLPNIPINCMANDKNGNDAIYVGTDAGVFFKDATLSVWQPFNGSPVTGELPNVVVSQLEIFYSGSKLRASTYGRGMWESGFYVPGAYAPDANFGADKLIGCPGLGVQFTDYSAGVPTSWSWSFPGGSPSSSTAQNPFVAYNTPGTYAVTLTATNGNGTDSQTFTNYITINSSPYAAPAAPGENFCAPASVILNATPAAPGTVRWWNQPAGGTILGTGNSFTTPVLSGTTTYYVDESFPSSGIDFVGAADNSMGAGAMFAANDIRGLYFDVLQPVVINSVKVYCNSTGLRTIEIIDANGNMVTDTTLNIPANPTNLQTVTINRTLYTGNNYFIKFRGLVDCYRNSTGASYPYTDGGSNSVIITNSNAGTPGYYYFFYDWQFTNIVCNTGRTACTATDTCAVIGINDLFANNYIGVFPNPNNGVFTVSFNTMTLDNYTVKVASVLGQTVYEEKLNAFSGKYSNKIDIASFRKGVYLLSVTNSKNETVKKVIVY